MGATVDEILQLANASNSRLVGKNRNSADSLLRQRGNKNVTTIQQGNKQAPTPTGGAPSGNKPPTSKNPTGGAPVSPDGLMVLDGQRVSTALGSALQRLIQAAGGGATVRSGFRTYEEQAELYRRYQNGTGNLAAPPGRSNHNTANAADLRYASDAVRQRIHQLAPEFGIHFPVRGENWHAELISHRRP